MDNFVTITDDEVDKLLSWDAITRAVKQALISITNSSTDGGNGVEKENLISVQTPRTFTFLPSGSGILICMPSFIQGMDLGEASAGGGRESSLACKLLTVFEGNADRRPPLPTSSGTVMLFDDKTGKIQAMIDADHLTQWRTAAVTLVASGLLGGQGRGRALAVLGAGAQGRKHALAFTDQFHFSEVRIWNRTTSRARSLVADLKALGVHAILSLSPQDCVQGADVIITATTPQEPIVQDGWIKTGAVVNVVGVGKKSELFPEVYQRSVVYVESYEAAKKELSSLHIDGELGELILGKKQLPSTDKIKIFQSLGVAGEDAAVARLVYNLKKKSLKAL